MDALSAISTDRSQWITRAVLLSWLTIIYNIIEGVVSIGFGVFDESVALAGFGVDSLIELTSAVLVLWRFRGETGRSEKLRLERERHATLGIGILFLLLAGITSVASLLQLSAGRRPDTTVPGLVISALSLSFMFFLWNSKQKVAKVLGSATVMKDADCSFACIKLSMVLFAGCLLSVILPQLGWFDSVAALGLAILIGKEGWETMRATRKTDCANGCGCSQ